MDLTRLLVQDAVYWAPGAPDGYGGRTYATPAELKCRWEDTARRARGPDGEEFITTAVVWVDEDLALGGLLYLGTLADLTDSEEADPQPVGGALAVRQFEKIPDLRGSVFVRRALL